VRVIDSSALVKYFSRESGWEEVERIMLEGVVTLDLAVKELANALRKKVSGNEMSFEIAARIIRDVVEGKPFPVEPQEPYLVEAFEMALRNDVTVYDALFVAMAKRKGLELVTCDEKQAKAARGEGVKAVLLG
jgi:predicted nucleic acid-binding protein